MKITPSYLYLSLLLCLLSYAPLDAQEAFNDSVALIKRNYINATVGKDKGKEVLFLVMVFSEFQYPFGMFFRFPPGTFRICVVDIFP